MISKPHGFILGILLLLTAFLVPSSTLAQEYVLPYPGFMPGHPLYRLSQFADTLEEWWSFGNFAKFKYHLSMADKKLIEAKTLFEYKQYLLGYQALQESDTHFDKAHRYLSLAKDEGKNISQKIKVLGNASLVHIDALQSMERNVPETFNWQPEKEASTSLLLKRQIVDAIELRKKSL